MPYITFDDGTREYFRRHPVYSDYGSNRQGDCIDFKRMKFIGDKLPNGCVMLNIFHEEKQYKITASIFIFQCFYGMYDKRNSKGKLMIVSHINNDAKDNRIENLLLISHSQKMKDLYNEGKHSKKPTKPNRCYGYKMNEYHDKNIKEVEIEFCSYGDAGRKTGCNPSSVQKCCNGKTDTCKSKNGGKWVFSLTKGFNNF